MVKRIARSRLRLRHAAQGLEFRQDDREQAEALHHRECAGRGRGRLGCSQDAQQLVANAFAGERGRRRRVTPKRVLRRRIELQAETGGKTHRTQQAQSVFRETLVRIANCAESAVLQVRRATVRIHEQATTRCEVLRDPADGIDRKVAAAEVLLQRAAPANLVGPALIAVARLDAERGHLD